MDNDCMYCTDNERLQKMLIFVTELSVSKVYLAKDQSFEGRCVVAFKNHKKELFDLTPNELEGFIKDVADTAEAISEIFRFDKINYAIFGDKLPHLHVHLTGKKSSDTDFGVPYNQCNRIPVNLLETEYQDTIQHIKEELKKRK